MSSTGPPSPVSGCQSTRRRVSWCSPCYFPVNDSGDDGGGRLGACTRYPFSSRVLVNRFPSYSDILWMQDSNAPWTMRGIYIRIGNPMAQVVPVCYEDIFKRVVHHDGLKHVGRCASMMRNGTLVPQTALSSIGMTRA